MVAFAASADKLKIAEVAHWQRCHQAKNPTISEQLAPVISWNSSFSVNIASIDAQHNRMVGMVNVLSESVARGEGKRVVGLMLDALMQYPKAHFVHEEGLMEKHGFPGLADHRAEHAAMTDTVLRFRRDFKAGKDDLSARLLQFLREWLSHHILGTDRQYSAFLRERGER